ncbi:hypothetical protein CPB83DRAFT_838701 [Crepidotus variabilis]|uniref:Uncharacterized protein n=1 Tax=Crepidotus variabilis TaxID=179855 RepID=A0A9P6JKX4_9AGAR|nr:hypothetical protein CPB83DRAFT_838701 [Crepidotus variabilis]
MYGSEIIPISSGVAVSVDFQFALSLDWPSAWLKDAIWFMVLILPKMKASISLVASNLPFTVTWLCRRWTKFRSENTDEPETLSRGAWPFLSSIKTLTRPVVLTSVFVLSLAGDSENHSLSHGSRNHRHFPYVKYTNIPNVTSVRVHPAGSVIVVGNDTGSIALYRIADANPLCHRFSLTYEYGGVSEICWIGHDYVAIGTTRGRLILFKLEGDGRRLYESSHVIAHGDGAAQVAVDSLAYDLTTKCLVSVGDGKKSVRMWDHAEDGSLKEKAQAISTTAYSIPRYVTFFREGHQLLVAFLERPVVHTFTINPFAFSQELRLELSEDHYIQSPQSQKCNVECSQALASLRDGMYVASVWGQSSIMIARTSDGKCCGCLKSRPGQEDLLAASSLTDDGLSTLTIWSNKKRLIVKNEQHEHSNVKIVVLCLAISLFFQVTVSFLPFHDLGRYFHTLEVEKLVAGDLDHRKIIYNEGGARVVHGGNGALTTNPNIGVSSTFIKKISETPAILVASPISSSLQIPQESLCSITL